MKQKPELQIETGIGSIRVVTASIGIKCSFCHFCHFLSSCEFQIWYSVFTSRQLSLRKSLRLRFLKNFPKITRIIRKFIFKCGWKKGFSGIRFITNWNLYFLVDLVVPLVCQSQSIWFCFREKSGNLLVLTAVRRANKLE